MLPVQLTSKDMPISSAIETHIRKKANKLSRFYSRIISCHVVIELQQKHKHQGKLYNIRIDVVVPGKKLMVTHQCDEDMYISIRNAFNAAARQLEDLSHIRHGRIKTHNDVKHGHVMRLIPAEGYGFIVGADGNEYYFSMTNVSYPKFAQLLIGDPVEYISEIFGDSQQAHHVVREKRRHDENAAA